MRLSTSPWQPLGEPSFWGRSFQNCFGKLRLSWVSRWSFKIDKRVFLFIKRNVSLSTLTTYMFLLKWGPEKWSRLSIWWQKTPLCRRSSKRSDIFQGAEIAARSPLCSDDCWKAAGAKRSVFSFLVKCWINATPAVRRLSPVITGTSVANGAQLQLVPVTSPSFAERPVVARRGRFPRWQDTNTRDHWETLKLIGSQVNDSKPRPSRM